MSSSDQTAPWVEWFASHGGKYETIEAAREGYEDERRVRKVLPKVFDELAQTEDEDHG